MGKGAAALGGLGAAVLAEAVRAARTVARLHPSGVHAAQRATRRAQGRRKRRAAAPPKAHALTRLPGLLVLDQQVLGEAAVQVGHCRDQGLDSLDRSMLLGRWRDVELGEQRLELSWDRHAVRLPGKVRAVPRSVACTEAAGTRCWAAERLRAL